MIKSDYHYPEVSPMKWRRAQDRKKESAAEVASVSFLELVPLASCQLSLKILAVGRRGSHLLRLWPDSTEVCIYNKYLRDLKSSLIDINGP
jgi:hypothetical protein